MSDNVQAGTTGPDDSASYQTGDIRQWALAVSGKLISLEANTLDPESPFHGRAVAAHFGRSVFADIQATAHRVERTKRLTTRDNGRYLKIFWQLDGSTKLVHSGGESVVRRGEWAIYDTSRPYIFEAPASARFQVLLLPIDGHIERVPQFDLFMGRPLEGGGAAEVARCGLAALLQPGCALHSDSQLVLQESLWALLGSVFNSGSGETVELVHRKRLQQARVFIESKLTDGALTPDCIARACGMSRRSLYSAFSAVGITPNAYIRQRRMSLASNLLCDTAVPRRISDVAAEVCFADSAHFTRSFTKQFGCSPRDWRRRVRT